MTFQDFFLKNNKNGVRTNEKFLIKNHFDIYQSIINFCDGEIENLPFKEKIWHFINNQKEIPKCKNCEKKLKFKRSISEGYGSYCSIACTNKSNEHKEKIKNSNQIKYGVDHFMQSEENKNKVKNTLIKKYGVDNIFKNKEYINNKVFEKYGVDHISKLDKTKEKIKKTNLEKFGASSPLQLKEVRNIGYQKKQKEFIKRYSNFEFIEIVNEDLKVKCNECYNIYEIRRSLFFNRVRSKINPCTLCNPVGEQKSIKELELGKFISSLGFDIVVGDKTILDGKEIDIFIPSKNIAIEFNGLYYHGSLFVDYKYHLNKTLKCEEKGIHLIQVFEDEWCEKNDIVKSRIKHYLGVSDNVVYARNCDIKFVDSNHSNIFLEENHIQGKIKGSIKIGLYYKDELISLMVFGKGRMATNSKKYDYELLRFCNKQNYNVVGSASRLLKYFEKNYNPISLISFADRRWSVGNLYRKLGFVENPSSNPNYYYVIGHKRINRINFQKHKLVSEGFSKNLSEKEIMESRKIYRIYDCGNLVFVKIY